MAHILRFAILPTSCLLLCPKIEPGLPYTCPRDSPNLLHGTQLSSKRIVYSPDNDERLDHGVVSSNNSGTGTSLTALNAGRSTSEQLPL